MPKRAFDGNGGIPPWVTLNPNPIKVRLGTPEPAFADEATVYLSPDKVECPTCGEPPGRPCQRLNGGGALRDGWHTAREHVE